MRAVRRGEEPSELADFKAAANENWTPRYRDFDKKAVVADKLAREQGYLCGYCGGRIGERKGDCHIEHVEAQSTRPDRALDYANMLASCQGSDATPPVPEHCGASRGNTPLLVTPFMADCARYFSYGSDGFIAPAPAPYEPAATDTIHVLLLDVAWLNAARAAAIDAALDGLQELSSSAWLAEAATYDALDPSGRLTPYCFVIQGVLLSYA